MENLSKKKQIAVGIFGLGLLGLSLFTYLRFKKENK
jgi:LPXTG-motif cell wall-anchored protein